MKKCIRVFAILMALANNAFAEDISDAITPTSKAYVDSGLATKASASALNIILTALSDNNTIAKSNTALQPTDIGTTSGTVAAGDDARFDTVPGVAPIGTPPPGRVFVWFE